MANTYNLIASTVLTSSQANVQFTGINSTYTDLILWASHRNDTAGRTNDQLVIRFDSATNTAHSRTQIAGDGATVTTDRTSSANTITVDDGTTGPSATSNTFATSIVYIPNYAGSTSKALNIDNATETNGTTAFRIASAGLYRSSSAISTIIIDTNNNFVSGSSFYLYGIRKS